MALLRESVVFVLFSVALALGTHKTGPVDRAVRILENDARELRGLTSRADDLLGSPLIKMLHDGVDLDAEEEEEIPVESFRDVERAPKESFDEVQEPRAIGEIEVAATTTNANILGEGFTTEQMADVINLCISLMLLGSVTFIMVTFYLVNHRDEDIKKIAWSVISTTISIFASVLVFQAIEGVVETYIIDGKSTTVTIVIYMVQMVIWWIILQILLAYFAGAMTKRFQELKIDEHTVFKDEKIASLEAKKQRKWDSEHQEEVKKVKTEHEEMVKKQKESLELDVKCWATLLGHITGFAAISGFGSIQQALPPKLYYTGGVPVVAGIGVAGVYSASNWIRFKIMTKRRGAKQSIGDKMYQGEATETENDVMALAVSFLFVQVIRQILTGSLPDIEGVDGDDVVISSKVPYLMAACGAAACFLLLFKCAAIPEKGGYFPRCHIYIRLILSMMMSWSLLFSIDYFLVHYVGVDEDGSICTVTAALIATFVGFGLIFIFDKIVDLFKPEEHKEGEGEPAHEGKEKEEHEEKKKFSVLVKEQLTKAFQACIMGLGILVGFAWERAFDAAVSGAASADAFNSIPPCFVKLIVASALALIVIPAWKWYILKVALENPYEEEEESEEEEEGEGKAPEGGEEKERRLPEGGLEAGLGGHEAPPTRDAMAPDLGPRSA